MCGVVYFSVEKKEGGGEMRGAVGCMAALFVFGVVLGERGGGFGRVWEGERGEEWSGGEVDGGQVR